MVSGRSVHPTQHLVHYRNALLFRIMNWLEGNAQRLRRPDLLIEDEEPFRLSRQHFMIARSGDRLLVSDLGSTLGTMVNGWAIGHHFMKDAEPLHRGENHIVAGGKDSPFEFLVSIS